VQSALLPALERDRRKLLLRVSAADTLYGLQRLREVGGLPFLLVGAHAMPPYRRRLKRLTDLTAVLLLSPLLVVVLVVTAIYVRLRAGRSVLFWQTRVGAGGHSFQMVKFRTMRPDAEEDGRARLAEAEDDRIVPGLGFLRQTRFDELPQLWNILRGEMGLVGPRPERPELTAQFEASIPGYARRHEVPPGITGLAQIHGRYHTDAEYKLGYDLQYLVNWSPVLDLEILVRTVWVVLARRV
jgi:lipopolysaccharide/colanic/teichoic acid biosynthesis glycosyltransferase